MTESLDETWSKLSVDVYQNPDSFEKWILLISHVSTSVSKASSTIQLEAFRASFHQFLSKFPLLEQYWVNYANIEFKLGNTHKSIIIYNQAISSIPHSYLIWINFLKLLTEIELNYENLLVYYQQAEKSIGYHYHSFEFWKSFIELEKKFNKKSIYYYNILVKVIQIPIFNYSYFFKLLLQEIEIINRDSLRNLVSDSDLIRKFKLDINKIDSLSDLHDTKAKLKKSFIDVYITTQFKSFELYQYEKKVSLEYYVPGIVKTYQDISNWDHYLTYMELNGTYPQIVHLYHRSLIAMAESSVIWIKFAEYYLKLNKLQDASNTLYQSLVFVPRTDLISIQLKLIKIEIRLKNYLKSRDLILLLLENDENNMALLKQLLNIEFILKGNSQDFLTFAKLLLDSQPPVNSSFLLEHISEFKSIKLLPDFLDALNIKGKFDNDVRYWIVLLRSVLKFSQNVELKLRYENALKNTNSDLRIVKWYERYGVYSSASGSDELKEYFKVKSKSIFKSQEIS